MRSDWYVLAHYKVGVIDLVRVVAGPLSLAAAETEAQHRTRKQPEGYRVVVVEFDPMFGLGPNT